MLWAMGVVSLFISGGLSGVWLAQAGPDIHLHDTMFVAAHFHLIMAGAALFGVFGATADWFPKMFGRMMNEPLGKIHFWLTFVTYYGTFFPMHYIGLAGHMRRIYDPYQYPFLKHLQGINEFITVSALILGASQIIFFVNFFWSAFKGQKADARTPGTRTASSGRRPRRRGTATGRARSPRSTAGPTTTAPPGAATDHVMQHEPAPVGERAGH